MEAAVDEGFGGTLVEGEVLGARRDAHGLCQYGVGVRVVEYEKLFFS